MKSLGEIRATLDDRGTLNGLAFLSGMEAYCGRRLKVYKHVRRIFLEESKQVRAIRYTVLLDGAICDGAGIGCDRSCFYYWREAWLRKVPE